ncbi:MAG: Mov34/MPN/PAD-1 family protein [Bacilli bacterium]|nr:Mov34/MPN/PAD-1 family protein [Bacilli bacterium]
MKIHALPEDDRPREKLFRLGPKFLTESELLALVLVSGTPGCNVVELSQLIFRRLKKRGLSELKEEDLHGIKGLGNGKKAALLALAELCERQTGQKATDHSLPSYLGAISSSMAEEAYVLSLGKGDEVLSCHLLAKGGDKSLVASHREALRLASAGKGTRFVFVHTHPKGLPYPSKQDIEATKRLGEDAGRIGLTLVDHLVLGEDGSFSFRENRLL